MRKILFIFFSFLLCSCVHTPNSSDLLYEEFMNIKPYSSISQIEGEGKIAIPNFMSWGIFNYSCDSTYIDSLLGFETFFENSEFNKNFKEYKTKEFPKDLSFWTEHTSKRYHVDFEMKNCVYLYGINFPYIHDVLIDTTDYQVLHLVSAMRG